MISEAASAYFDSASTMHTWPSRKRRDNQLAVLAEIASSFVPGEQYNEKEVNAIIQSRIQITDFVLIRRELIEAHLLKRTLNGSAYWRSEPSE